MKSVQCQFKIALEDAVHPAHVEQDRFIWTVKIYRQACDIAGTIAKERGIDIVIQRSDFKPDDIEQTVTALRKLFGEFLNDSGNVQRIADLISGADIRYAAGPHPLVGRWAPDLTVNSVRLADLMRSGRPLLVDLTPAGTFAGVPVPEQVDVVTGHGERPIALLIRPDGYIAWAAEQDGATKHDGIAEHDGLRDAFAQWFQPRPLTSATR